MQSAIRELSSRAVSTLRTASLVAGTLCMAIAVFADSFGLSIGQGIGRNQVILGLLGVLLISAGILGRSFPRAYRAFGVIFLNTLVALALLELVSIVLFKLLNPLSAPSRLSERKREAFITSQTTSLMSRYVPFLLWKAYPDQAGGESTDCDGNRVTPGASMDEEAFEVWLFGGSSMWGTSVPDSCTIAAYVQSLLDDRLDCAVDVVNYGQIAWVSTQELFQLVLDLRAGGTPDLVVFYDGFNDVETAYSSGLAGVHYDYRRLRDRMEGREEAEIRSRILLTLVESSNTYQLARTLARGGIRMEGNPSAIPLEPPDPDDMSLSVLEVYAGNMRAVRALSAGMGFRCAFFWQPTIWTGDKALTPEEERISRGGFAQFPAGSDPAFALLLARSYERADSVSRSCGDFVVMSGVLDSIPERLYTDAAGCHLNAAGNLIVARSLVEHLDRMGLLPAPGAEGRLRSP